MKIVFTDSFRNSLKRVIRQNSWWYKIYSFFSDGLLNFFKNLWFFRKELFEFRPWDYGYNLSIFRRSLEKTVRTIEKYGYEVEEIKCKKVDKMKRVIEILQNLKEHNYLTRAQNELGEIRNLYSWMDEDFEESHEDEEHNRKIFDKASQLEKSEWEEFWSILKGQDIEEYRKLYDLLPEEEKRKGSFWNQWYDGSGIQNWWD